MFLNLFIFLNLNFLCGSIQTDKVIIDSSDIIDTHSKLINTQKMLMIRIDDELFAGNSKNSFWTKIYMKKATTNQLWLFKPLMNRKDTENFRDKMNEIGLSSYLFLNKDINLYYSMIILSSFALEKGLVGYLKPKSYAEFLEAFYMRKNLDTFKKRLIHQK